MLWTDLLSGKKNAAAMQFYKRYNAMLLKQMYVEYEKGGKTKKQMKKKKKDSPKSHVMSSSRPLFSFGLRRPRPPLSVLSAVFPPQLLCPPVRTSLFNEPEPGQACHHE